MVKELDVVVLTRNINTNDIEGDEVSLIAGARGTVMVIQMDNPECIVEFGDEPENAVMVSVSKQNLKLVWSHEQQLRKKLAG